MGLSKRQFWIFRTALAVAAVIILVVAVAVTKASWISLVESLESRHWPNVPGRMIDGTVEWGHAGAEHGPSYQLHFHYLFTVAGKEYEGTEINPGVITKTSRLGEYEMRYRQGSQVAVYYDPADPARCVLEPGPTLGHWLFLFFASPVLLGMAVMFGFGAWKARMEEGGSGGH